MELKIKLYEGTESRMAKVMKQKGIEKNVVVADKHFGEEGHTADDLVEKVRAHFEKKLKEAQVLKEDEELTVNVETVTLEHYTAMKLNNLKKAAKVAKGTELELINAAIEALKPEKKVRESHRLTDEEFEQTAADAKADLGRTVSFKKYGKTGEVLEGTIIGIRKDKRVNGIQYVIDIHDEEGNRTGRKFGKVVGSADLTFTSDPVDWEATKAAARAAKAEAKKAAEAPAEEPVEEAPAEAAEE